MEPKISRYYQTSGCTSLDEQYKAGVILLKNGDYQGAVNALRSTAAAGHVSSIFNLALLYKQGLTESFDIESAIALFGEAAAQGHERARLNYELFQRLGGDRSLDNAALASLFSNFNREAGDGAFVYGLAHEILRMLLNQGDRKEFVMMELDGANQGNDAARRFVESTGIPSARYDGALGRSCEGTPPRLASDALDHLSVNLMQVGVPQRNVIFSRCSIVGYVIKKSGIAPMPSLLPFTAYIVSD